MHYLTLTNHLSALNCLQYKDEYNLLLRNEWFLSEYCVMRHNPIENNNIYLHPKKFDSCIYSETIVRFSHSTLIEM